MAKAVVNPQAQLTARAGDVQLSLDQLAALEVFASLKKSPAFAKFPGSYVLRQYRKGEAICRQGDSGGSAFYLLTAKDLDALAATIAASPSAASPELPQLVEHMRGKVRGAATAAGGQPRRVATARLFVSGTATPKGGERSWRNFWRGGDPANGPQKPSTIANDGPTDIDYQTRQAAIHEGEVFGEMSCLTRQPRSATVEADVDCFALEILRNILDQMRKDPEYKQLTDKKYRERVLEGHLRQLSIFRLLSDRQFRDVLDQVELVEVPAGTVIWDEGDVADALCVVRSGIVQVVQAYPWQLTANAITDWPKLVAVLVGKSEVNAAAARLAAAVPASVKEALAAAGDAPPAEVQRLTLDALNQIAKTDALLSAKEMQPILSDPRFARETADFPAKVKSWTGMQRRRGNRVLFHLLSPEAVAPAEPVGLGRVTQYLGRGSIFGEIGLMLQQARSATCIAYSHPEADRESTDVELVRVSADVVRKLIAASPAIQTEIRKIAETRTQRDRAAERIPISSVFQSRRVEELGLRQGQNLMLIDLDRCTRCGDCVEACIATHNDGHSRLFLDGPRFGKYLVPSSCRLCRDPVCMIGCPVGSIQQGADGEVVIRDWCIGCGVCARQCPYDSIQMHDTAIIPSAAPGWQWIENLDVAANAKWKDLGHSPARWKFANAPFRWDIDLIESITAGRPNGRGTPKVTKFFFRLAFEVAELPVEAARGYELAVTSQSNALELYLNNQPLPLTQDAAQKKRGEHVAAIPVSMVRRGANILAARVDAPSEYGATILDVRLDRAAPEGVDFEEKAVTERAVVCDQCSTLSGNRHACVYACPHEAALRVDAWIDLPAM